MQNDPAALDYIVTASVHAKAFIGTVCRVTPCAVLGGHHAALGLLHHEQLH